MAAATSTSSCLHRPQARGWTLIARARSGRAVPESLPEEEFEEDEEGGEFEDEATTALARARGKVAADYSPEVVDPNGPPLPAPCEYQQTLWKSFTVCGIGLHSGDYACVRVRPAYAGEGRYFVRVAEGSNEHLFDPREEQDDMGDTQVVPLDEAGMELQDDEEDPDPEQKQMLVQLYQDYVQAQEEDGYDGTFAEYSEQRNMPVYADLLRRLGPPDYDFGPPEAVKGRSEADGPYLIPASISAAQDDFMAMVLAHENGDDVIMSVEALLSALEACGVDNARIEIEGGCEVPVVDGSAWLWADEIACAGLRLATLPGGQDPVDRMVMQPNQVVTVQGEGGSFVSLYPEATQRLTVGIDQSGDAAVIGKQWLSWSPLEDLHYKMEIADARAYVPSLEMAVALRDEGYLQGGTEGVVLIAQGEQWQEPSMVRHQLDEPVRYHMMGLIGDLALAARPGSAGLPLGHVVAYLADHALQAAFVRKLAEVCAGDEHWVRTADALGPTQPVDYQAILDAAEGGFVEEESVAEEEAEGAEGAAEDELEELEEEEEAAEYEEDEIEEVEEEEPEQPPPPPPRQGVGRPKGKAT